ncbi:MAG: MOSC domain-containing protein [Paracoccaceae bacterium]
MRVESLWRHPIKAHGRERVARANLTAGAMMPGDRIWAVAHEAASAVDGADWVPCRNFNRAAKAPALMAIESAWDEAAGTVTLTHPDREPLTFDPDRDGDAIVAWTRDMTPEGRAAPARVVRARGAAFSDSDFPSISLISLASHRALEAEMGRELSPLRWRGNLLIEGAEAWEEASWVGREIAVGGARLRVRERIVRCRATMANPESGVVDADTLTALRPHGDQEFGVCAEVIEGGPVAEGDALVLA